MTDRLSQDGSAIVGQEPEARLFNRGFVLLSVALFLVFCNMAVFFEFYGYLKRLPIPQSSLGLIIGVFALTALLIRPFISLALHPSNAKPWLIVGVLGAVAALMLYGRATTVTELILVRVLHGAFYVLMAAACVAALVGCIDKRRSGQAFGLLAVITIVPYAVVPPLAEALRRLVPSYPDLLALTGLTMLLVIPMVLLVPAPKLEGQVEDKRISWKEAKENLKSPGLLVLLCSALLMYIPFTTIFYFINSYAQNLGILDAGLFFTVATGTEIGMRVLFGRFFDNFPKNRLLGGSLVLLAVAFYILTMVTGMGGLLTLAVVFGLGWGVAMPMVNAMLFELSKPELRAFNTNLGYEVFQGGFFLGPFLGAWLVQATGYSGLYMACAGACLSGAALMLVFERNEAVSR
jgi:predicted MFS family arabinose efflux permease